MTIELLGRRAKCTMCATIANSDLSLAFFEFYGDGSARATKTCTCRYSDVAHVNYPDRFKHTFVAIGAADVDSYYCGCRGWD